MSGFLVNKKLLGMFVPVKGKICHLVILMAGFQGLLPVGTTHCSPGKWSLVHNKGEGAVPNSQSLKPRLWVRLLSLALLFNI